MVELRTRLQQFGVWLRAHRRWAVGVVCVLAVALVIWPAVAAPPSAGEGGGGLDWYENVALAVARFFSYIAIGMTKFIIVIIHFMLIPVLRYNSFTTAPIVIQGWVVVRDLVNMFFVVILLLIAFQTIFNIGRADWKRQVPRLLIMAIVINFSRTIAGVLIDFGQVVMLSFVSAIENVAGGNFIQLFGLDKLFSFSTGAATSLGQVNEGFQVFDFFIAAFLTMVLTFVIAGTMIILAALMAFRIVILWCLVILAPLTFFLGGAKGVVGPAEGYYADWWKRFTSAVTLGPMLTFFVWLALAAASGGSLAEKQDFDTGIANEETSAGSIGTFITEAFDAPHMTSLIIAIALLFAGIELSQQTASSIGGRAGELAKKGVAGIPGLSRTMARIGAGAVPAGYGLAKRGAKAVTTVKFQERVAAGMGKGIRDFGAAVATVPIISGAGRATMQYGVGILQKQNVHKEAEREEAWKSLAGMGPANLKALAFQPDSPTMTHAQKLQKEQAALSLLTKERNFATLSDAEITQLGEVWGETRAEQPDSVLEKAGQTFLNYDPRISEHEQPTDADKAKYTKDGVFNEQAFKDGKVQAQLAAMANNPGSILQMQQQALGDARVQRFMAGIKVRGTEKNMTDWLGERGKQVQKDVLAEGAEARAGELRSEIATAAAPGGDTAKLIEAIKSIRPDKVVATIDPATMSNLNFAQAFKDNASSGTFQAAMNKKDLRDAFTSSLSASTIGAMIDGTEPERLKDMTGNAALAETISDALAQSDEAIRQAATTVTTDAAGKVVGKTVNEEEVEKGWTANAKRRLKAGYDVEAIGYDSGANAGRGGFTGATPAEQGMREGAFENVFVDSPEVIQNLTQQIAANNYDNTLAEKVAGAVNDAVLTKIQNKVRGAVGDPAAMQTITGSINQLEKVMIMRMNKFTTEQAAERDAMAKKLARLQETRARFRIPRR